MQIYSAYYRRRYSQTILPIILPFIILLVIGLSLGFLVYHVTKRPTISPLAQAQQIPISPSPVPVLSEKNKEELTSRIEDALDDSIPQYSIVVDDFLRPFTVELGDQITFSGASIHKIPILISIAKEIQNEQLTWDKEIVFEDRDRQDYGTGSIRYQKAGTVYTVKELATVMMEQSDNTAAYILGRRVLNFELIQKNLSSWGLQETSMEENTTTNQDMNTLFRQLFTGTVLPSTQTRDVINLLDDSLYEDRIPALLPQNATIYHKIGTSIAELHDVGVIGTDNSLYYVGIFTKGVSDEERATRAIARVSKAIFDYMQE